LKPFVSLPDKPSIEASPALAVAKPFVSFIKAPSVLTVAKTESVSASGTHGFYSKSKGKSYLDIVSAKTPGSATA
jgi:hypothetical protein